MQPFSISPFTLIKSVFVHRNLIRVLIRREVIGRYQGSVLGIVWSFFTPALMLVVYTFVFSVVFKARWAGGGDSKSEFALVLFAGLLVFNLFSECVNRAPGLVLANTNYVKKIVFPLEILPLVSLGAALFHTTVSLLAWLVFYVILFGVPPATLFLLPLVLFPLVLLTLGISWFLASLSVYLRDIGQLTGIITTALLFLSPIFYPLSTLPPGYQVALQANPLTLPVELARDMLFWGRMPHWSNLATYSAVSMLIAWSGFAWFQRTRKGFADVI
ncbi:MULTISPECIES: ABC transporter permease [Pseudomonas]|uniref:ABC transporter permease n=1 Tax=Pseudomonas TaxID=286 RepID=UPI001BE540F1|nr:MULTISPECIES: ABC transporter permease [Pseudomonas]MBT2339001.1 ABC transporter permease [Pseudomonas fluorescens]MCD4527787.1 ABC transporter permease [Pseudomonas sp. C3-2018]